MAFDWAGAKHSGPSFDAEFTHIETATAVIKSAGYGWSNSCNNFSGVSYSNHVG